MNVSSLERQTLQTLLNNHVETNSRRAAIDSATKTLSYQELAEQVKQLSGGLRSLGIGKGDIVAVQLPNSPEFIISYLAITAIGGITQTLHMPYQETELSYLIQDSNARAVIALSQFKNYSPAKILLTIAANIEHPMDVIAIGEEIKGTVPFSNLSDHPAIDENISVEADDAFVLLYTSGTTSQPKGVVHNYKRFLSNAQLCAKEYEFTHEDRILSLAPLSHLYGLFTCNVALVSGAASILLPMFDPESFVTTVNTLKPTAIFAGPAHFNACFHKELINTTDFDSVKFVCLSGSHVPSELARKVDTILSRGKVGQLWGMSELQAGAITRLSDTEEIRLKTTGSATPGTELRVASDKGVVLDANQEGELQVKGISVFTNYLNKPEETKRAFTQDEWFKTGDLAILDEEGNLIITGRTKHIINRGGVKYNPIEIEDIINEHTTVHQCAIIAMPDETLGEKACVFVEADDKSITLDTITNVLATAGIAKYKWPEKLIAIKKMPMTPTNKVKHEELKNILTSNDF